MKISYGENELEMYDAFYSLLPSRIAKINVHLRGYKYPDISFMSGDEEGLTVDMDDFPETNDQHKMRHSYVSFVPENDAEKEILKQQLFYRKLGHEVEILLIPNKVLHPDVEWNVK